MKLLILSDSHYISINSSFDVEKILGNINDLEYDCALLAGDIGVLDLEIRLFLDKYFKNRKVCFLGGNHIVYKQGNETLPEINQHYKKLYPLDNDWSFMENDYKIIGDTVIIGCNLYTDYKYHRDTIHHYHFEDLQRVQDKAFTVKDYIKLNKYIADRNMNDFRYGKMSDMDFIVRRLSPNDYEKFHKESLKYIDKIYKQFENTDYKIVVMTHHCPSAKCISPIYYNSDLNASFVSDLDKWILKHPKINLWVCGHVHSPVNTTVGSTKLICNPIGYIMYKEHINFKPIIVEI